MKIIIPESYEELAITLSMDENINDAFKSNLISISMRPSVDHVSGDVRQQIVDVNLKNGRGSSMAKVGDSVEFIKGGGIIITRRKIQ